jgi:hypothetical protein
MSSSWGLAESHACLLRECAGSYSWTARTCCRQFKGTSAAPLSND